MRSGRFKLALIQMLISPGEAEENLQRAIALIRTADQNKAEVILLPEAPKECEPWSRRSGRSAVLLGQCRVASLEATDCAHE